MSNQVPSELVQSMASQCKQTYITLILHGLACGVLQSGGLTNGLHLHLSVQLVSFL